MAALLAACLIAGVTSCDSSEDAQQPEARKGFNPAAPWRDFPSSDPSATVLSFWRLIQIGAYPAAVAGYDRSVVSAVGADTFLDVIAAQRTGVAALKPAVVDTRRTARGLIVAVDAKNARGQGGSFSFWLERRDGRWQIVYDSLLGDTIADAVGLSFERLTSGKEKAGLGSRRKGVQVARVYRRAALQVFEPRVTAQGEVRP